MERREIIKSLFTPEMLREHPKYKVLVDLVSREMGRSADCIELIPILGSPELMPAKYLPAICSMLGIDYNYNQPAEAHREILKRIFDARKNRGTSESLRKAAARAPDPNFYIEDLTYYNKKIQEQSVNFYPAHNRIFRYSVSQASGNHYLEDGDSWDMGFLVVEIEDWSNRVKEKVYSVLPAGRLIWVHMFISLYGEELLTLTPYESWDVNTGERVVKDEWAQPGEYYEVSVPRGEVGTSVERIMDLGTRDEQSPMMIYSVRGCLSGAREGEETEWSHAVMSGMVTGRKQFEQSMDLWCRSNFTGGDDVLSWKYVRNPSILENPRFDGYFFDPELSLEVWNGGYDEGIDGGSFGTNSMVGKKIVRTKVPEVGNLFYDVESDLWLLYDGTNWVENEFRPLVCDGFDNKS